MARKGTSSHKFRRNLKAQAAMEFLMTYGWAILVVLIAIGALAYFGVLNPDRFLPESCTIGPGIGCDDFQVTTDGVVTVILRNGMGDDLRSVSVGIGDNSSNCTGATIMNNGNYSTYVCGTHLTGTAGKRFQENVNFTYTGDSGLRHSKTGTLTSKYE